MLDIRGKEGFERGRKKSRGKGALCAKTREMRSLKALNLVSDEWGRRRFMRGLTMVEVLVVVVIIAIAAAMAVPMMSGTGSMQVRSAANMIAADLEYAKSMAISRGQNFSVVFDETAESYQIEDQNGDVILHPVKKGFYYVIDFQAEGRLDKVEIVDADFGGSAEVTFDLLGSPNEGGSVSLEAGVKAMTVTVEPVTGFISISD